MIKTAVNKLPNWKITSADDYLRAAQHNIAALRALGINVAIHEDTTPCHAYINHGCWVIDCQCGAGNAVDPSFPFAVCMECGATHRTIVYPVDRADLEAELELRPNEKTQNWKPAEVAAKQGRKGETLDTLKAQNAASGIGKGRPTP